MTISLTCPYCKTALTAPETAVGKFTRCPKCRVKFAVPAVPRYSATHHAAEMEYASPPPPHPHSPVPARHISLQNAFFGGAALILATVIACTAMFGSRPATTTTPSPVPVKTLDVVEKAPPSYRPVEEKSDPPLKIDPPSNTKFEYSSYSRKTETPVISTPVTQDPDQSAVDRTRRFLDTADHGRFVLGYLHFGSTYGGHTYLDTRTVLDQYQSKIPGQFALVYDFRWQDDGKTQLAFLCDGSGNIFKVQVLSTNAQLNQPFLSANLAIITLGNVLVEAFKDRLSEDEERRIRQAIDQGDAKTLLEAGLFFQQKLGL